MSLTLKYTTRYTGAKSMKVKRYVKTVITDNGLFVVSKDRKDRIVLNLLTTEGFKKSATIETNEVYCDGKFLFYVVENFIIKRNGETEEIILSLPEHYHTWRICSTRHIIETYVLACKDQTGKDHLITLKEKEISEYNLDSQVIKDIGFNPHSEYNKFSFNRFTLFCVVPSLENYYYYEVGTDNYLTLPNKCNIKEAVYYQNNTISNDHSLVIFSGDNTLNIISAEEIYENFKEGNFGKPEGFSCSSSTLQIDNKGKNEINEVVYYTKEIIIMAKVTPIIKNGIRYKVEISKTSSVTFDKQ